MDSRQQAQSTRPKKVGFWKIGVGAILLLLGLLNFLPSSSNALRPNNAGETTGYFLITVVILLLGLFFVIFGLKNLWLSPAETGIDQNRSKNE